jgi:hypothetical protein
MGMLLKAEPGFEPDSGQHEAAVLAVVMLILLQPDALQQITILGGPMTVQFTTESSAVVNGLAQLRAQLAAGEQADGTPMERMDKLLHSKLFGAVFHTSRPYMSRSWLGPSL